MAIVAASLATGQLPSGASAILYTSAAKSYVKAIILNNQGATAQTVVIYFKRASGGDTQKTIFRAVLALGETGYAVDKDSALSMSAGDKIEGLATTATQVDYVILGATEA